MSIAKDGVTGKGNELADRVVPSDSWVEMAQAVDRWIRTATDEGLPFHEFESTWHEIIHLMGNRREAH